MVKKICDRCGKKTSRIKTLKENNQTIDICMDCIPKLKNEVEE